MGRDKKRNDETMICWTNAAPIDSIACSFLYKSRSVNLAGPPSVALKHLRFCRRHGQDQDQVMDWTISLFF